MAERRPRPYLQTKDTIDQYSDADLARMVRWLKSDGLLRTDDQLLDAMMDELGFERRGAKIVSRIEEAIERNRTS